MAKDSRKIKFKTLRIAFDRFPNEDLGHAIQLGAIGRYISRKNRFVWITSLTNLGVTPIILGTVATPPIENNIYTTGQSTNCEFTLDGNGTGLANIEFQQSHTLASQAIAMSSVSCDIYDLEPKIKNAIRGGIEWDKEWIVVTQIFPAESYTLIYSSSKNSKASVSTGIPIGNRAFNIADPTLNLSISHISGEVSNVLAEQNVTPFFRFHKLKGWGIGRPSISRVSQTKLEIFG